MKVDPDGQPSVTTWKVMGRVPRRGKARRAAPPVALLASITWLALEPLTGRTHQLRVHCAAMGWPIIGNSIYGNTPRTGGPPLQLHAREVVVLIYKNKPRVRRWRQCPAHQDRLRLRLAGRGLQAGGLGGPARSSFFPKY